VKIASAALVLLFGGFVQPKPACAATPQFEVQLKKAWVETYMDRTSITAEMTIHHSHQRPNQVGKGSQDGDLHFSGEADIVGLPFVAEIVNAASENSAVASVKKIASANEQDPNHETSISVTGAWRLWFEHPSKEQIQGGDNPFLPDNTNPNHSFEIHPVSEIESPEEPALDVRDKIVPVENFSTHKVFEAYDAETALPYFESLSLVIKASQSAIAIRSNQLKYNYVKFSVELTQKPKKVSDGYIALGRVVSDDAEETDLPGQLRLIFVEGTKGADAMSNAKVGDSFTLLGIPRLNLNAIDTLVKQNGTAQFTAKLPYEMIIVGVY
jgi:hypothetical protein